MLRRAEPADQDRTAALEASSEDHELRLDLVDTQRATLLRLRNQGSYGSEALTEQLRILDAEQIGLELRANAVPTEDD